MSKPNQNTDSTIQTSVQQYRDLYEITTNDLMAITTVASEILKNMDSVVKAFYGWMESDPTYTAFFTSEEQKEGAIKGQIKYWERFLSGNVDEAYLGKLRDLGNIHAHIGLPLDAYFAGMNVFYLEFIKILNQNTPSSIREVASHAITKLMHFDTAIVVETFNARSQRIIDEQNESLMELSTPVSTIWDGILMLPIVGIIDSKRAQEIMDTMLLKITETQSSVIILDISGVSVVDTAVSNHIIKMTKATKLMGCECILSGVSAPIAQTIVSLGIDLSQIYTRATLKDALYYAFTATGNEVSSVGSGKGSIGKR